MGMFHVTFHHTLPITKFCNLLCTQGLSLPGHQPTGSAAVRTVQTVSASTGPKGIITQIIYVKGSRQFFAACLDDTLKLYNEHFRLQASFKWHGGIVASMLYNSAFDELITAGRNGVKVWYCEPDYKAFARNAAAPLKTGTRSSPLLGSSATFASKLKGGKAPPWQLGAFQSIHERVTFR